MKKFLPFFILAIFALGACETVEIEKLVFDTVYVDKPIRSLVQTIHTDTVYKELLRVDTVEVTVVVHDTIIQNVVVHDTVFQVKTDSVFIETIVEKIVNHYDTIVQTVYDTIINNVIKTVYVDKIVEVHDTIYVTEYEQRVIYQSVQFLFPGQSTWYIPGPLLQLYNDYIKEGQDRNKPLPGGDLVVTYVPADQLPGESWVSNFFIMSGDQAVIEISEELTFEQSRAAMYRELTRWQLKKKYSNDVNKIMSPLYDPKKTITKPELDELFR